LRRSTLVLLSALMMLLTVLAGAGNAATSTVKTASGVTTHGSINTTENTVGWLLTCALSHRLPDDPITAPGRSGGAHLHDFTGNASTSAASTLSSMEDLANTASNATQNNGTAAAGTSCNLPTFSPGTGGDTAAYWRPVLYANGKPLTSTTKDQLYYRAKPTFGTGFKAIPQDARLIVGSHMATSLDGNAALRDGHLYWECSGVSNVHYKLPPNNCKGGSILENVVFPSCWDGTAMDHTGPNGTDNNHFAYAAGNACPSNFAVKVPQLSEKFKYDNVPAGAALAFSADPGMKDLSPGYTAHADFWNTWRPAALQYLVDKCINAKLSCGTNPVTPLS
jgi:hypothetical protein